jgi:PucR-like helix-turn-helix protein
MSPDMAVAERGEIIERIARRANLDEFADRLLDAFWDRPEFQQLHPPRNRVRAWVRWNLELVLRWLIDGRPPSDAELERIREHARDRAAEGVPADIVPANFRTGARFAWRALLEAATEDERPALLQSADLLFEYVDRVSRIYAEAYDEMARSGAATSDEPAARSLLHRVAFDEAPLPEDHQLAERIGFRLDRRARPFVVAVPGRSLEHHAALAATLRRHGALAASEGRRVVGLASGNRPWEELQLEPQAILAVGPAAIGTERTIALDELRDAVEAAGSAGDSGEVSVGQYLPEILLIRSARIADRIADRVYGRLDEELARTLDLLVAHSFERAAAASALPVHRNTLRDRIHRISAATGVDLETAQGRGLAWLAWLQRRRLQK